MGPTEITDNRICGPVTIESDIRDERNHLY